MTATVDLPTETKRYVKALDRRPLRTLCERVGVPTDRPAAPTATALVDAFADGAKAADLREALSPFGKSLLDRLVLAGEHGVQQAVQTGNEVTPGLGYGAPMHLALEELRLAGLIRGHDFDARDGVPFLLPPLKRALLWPTLEARLAPLAEPTAPQPPPAFRLAVAAGLFATDEPALVRSGEIHSSAYNKLAKRFADREPWAARLVEASGDLRALGVLTTTTVGPRTTLTLSTDGASRALGRPPLEIALARLSRQPRHFHLEVFAHLRTVAKRQPDGAASIRELASLPVVLRTEAGPYDFRPPLDAAGLADLLRHLVDRGLAERASPDGAPVRFRPLDERAVHGTGRFVVLPSLEVLVGWDVPPATVAALAAVADLEAVDRVCRYRLTRSSVARGVRLLGDGNAVRRFLEEGSGQPVAQNVEMTIAGWAGAVRILRSYRGEVVVADTPELRALVARDASDAEEFAPGVFLLPPGGLAALGKRAKQEGVTMPATLAADPLFGDDLTTDHPHVSTADADGIDDHLRSTQRRLATLEAAATKTHAEFGRPPADGGRGRKRTAPSPSEFVPQAPPSAKPAAPREPLGTPSPIPPRSAPRPEPVERQLPDAWTSPLPGILREQLEIAAAMSLPVDVLYVNSKHVPTELRVTPRRIRHTDGVAYLDAIDVRRGSDFTLALDRITSLRAAARAK